MKKKTKKRLIIIAAILAFLFISNAIATKIIYDFIFSRYDGEPDFDTSVFAELMDSRQEVRLSEEKGELQGYFYDVENELGVIVIVPGLHAGADDYLYHTEYFCNAGYDVFSFDPLGCVASGGKSTIGFSQEIEDLEVVLDYVESTYGEDIYLFGHSRGGFAVCSMLDSDHDVKAVVTVSGLNSAMEAVIGLSSRYVGPVANANYPDLWAYQAMLFGAKTMGIQADELISATETPVLVVQGSADSTAPAEKYSIYSHKDEITGDNVSYIYLTDEGRNGHTDLMFSEEKGLNIDLMQQIVDFYGEAK